MRFHIPAVALCAVMCVGPEPARADNGRSPALEAGIVTDAQWDEWMEELGAEEGERREAARADILQHAGAVRGRIRRAWAAAGDPDMRLQLGRIWDEARWRVIPGFSKQDASRLLGSFGDPDVVKAWDEATDQFGAPLVRVMIEVRRTPGQTVTAARAFARMCARLPPPAVAVAVADMAPIGETTESVKALLIDAAHPPADSVALHRMAEVALALGWYPEALAVSREGFERHDDFPIDPAEAAVRQGRLEDEAIRQMRSLVADRSNRITPRTWLFYLQMFERLGLGDRVPADLPSGLVTVWPPELAREAVRRLVGLGRPELARRALGPSDSAMTLYLNGYVRSQSDPGAKAEAAADVGRAVTLARGMDDGGAFLLRMGEWMEQDGRSPEAAWAALLERTDAASAPAAASAALRWAERHERNGRWEDAIRLYERALQASRRPGASLVLRAGGRATDGRPAVEAKIRELRMKIQRGDEGR